MKKLQVVIVNYNVRYFLEQCLLSVFTALEGIPSEVWVVDNASQDDSLDVLRERFPQVRIIANQQNLGFAKANNQAIRQGDSDYVLLLNPDTLVDQHSMQQAIDHMDQDPQVGALGIRMIDGAGNYLPESKRGLPTPWVAFCKTLHLHKLFPSAVPFNGYYLGYLDPHRNHQVPVLSGAFMCLRRSALEHTGLLDEDYFMYGEDVDLSYQMTKAGYKNLYVADSSIIHYKGESTKKGSLDYLVAFYRAMILFSQKHFEGSKALFYTFFVRLAIVLHGFFSLVKYRFLRVFAPVADAVLLYAGMYGLTQWWEIYRFDNPAYYRPSMYFVNIPVYLGVWMLCAWLSGAYDSQQRTSGLFRGLTVGLVLILVIYALWGEDLRHSRMLILMSFAMVLFYMLVLRRLLFGSRRLSPKWSLKPRTGRTLIIGTESENQRVIDLLVKMQRGPERWMSLTVDEYRSAAELQEIATLQGIEEIIFCLRDLPMSEVIAAMDHIGSSVRYRFVGPDSKVIVGSPSRNSRADVYTIDLEWRIDEPASRRNKWLFDRLSALLLLIVSPVGLLLSHQKGSYMGRCLAVLFGRKSWVSYIDHHRTSPPLPKIKSGVFSPISGLRSTTALHALYDVSYARDYSWWADLTILFRNI